MGSQEIASRYKKLEAPRFGMETDGPSKLLKQIGWICFVNYLLAQSMELMCMQPCEETARARVSDVEEVMLMGRK